MNYFLQLKPHPSESSISVVESYEVSDHQKESSPKDSSVVESEEESPKALLKALSAFSYENESDSVEEDAVPHHQQL